MKYLLNEKLKNLIGLKIVKEQIDNIIAADIVEKDGRSETETTIRAVRCT